MVLQTRRPRFVRAAFVVALVAMGVAPSWAAPPVLNVEVDWLVEPYGHSHKPNPCELAAVQLAFARHGIVLNIEMGNAIEETAVNKVINFAAVNSFDQGAGEWNDLEVANRFHAPDTGWHYMIFGHDYGINSDLASTSSGLAEINGDEFLVSLGSFANMVGTPWDRSGTFMHEFGHNLGLRHSGDQNENVVCQFKPNYPSVMAYRYQLIGVRRGIQCQNLGYPPPPLPFFHLDYSNGTLCDLDEEALVEKDGIGFGGVDWNCQGQIVGTVSQDVSSGTNWCIAGNPMVCNGAGNKTILEDYDDWSNLDLTAAYAAAPTPPEVVTCNPPPDLERVIPCVQPDPCVPDDPSQCSNDDECDDGNPCTDDTCGSVGGVFVCNHASNDANACSDNNPCTRDDRCEDGACVGDQRCHFQCYETRRETFATSPVSLVDQFGTANGVVLSRPERLCAPADKNGEDPTAPADPEHLVGYPIRAPFTKKLNLRIENQFGETFVDATKRASVLVPSSKSLQPPFPAPLVGPTLDHFQCYKVRRSRGTPRFLAVPNVSVVDQFGPHVLTLRKPIKLCAPVNKNDESREAPQHTDHLLCYKARVERFPSLPVFLTNQFGQIERELLRRVEFCVPSRKNEVDDEPCEPGTTSTIVTTTTTTTTTLAICGDGIIQGDEQCDPPGDVVCPDGSPAGAFVPCSPGCTCQTYFRDEVDVGDDAFNAGCHYSFSDTVCTENKIFFSGDSCPSPLDLFEWTDQACHAHAPALDQTLHHCDIECAPMLGQCVTVPNFCGPGNDSARCVCS